MSIVQVLKRFVIQTWNTFSALSSTKKTLIICTIVFIVLFLRKTELLLNPQFWAEDGGIFYKNAYNNGLASLFDPYAGAFHTFSRIISLIAVQFPLRFGPIIYSIFAILSMILPVFVLWSDASILKKEGELRKLILTILYLFLPNVSEIFGNLTNTHWYLALAAILVLIRTDKIAAKKWLPFDALLLIISGLSGPAVILLLLPALLLTYTKKHRANVIKLLIVAICVGIQIFVYSRVSTSAYSLTQQGKIAAHNIDRPIEITGLRFLLIPVIGTDVISKNDIVSYEAAESAHVFLMGVIVLSLVFVAMLKSRTEIKAVLLFCFTLYATSLLRAQNEPVNQFWDILQFSTQGERYFFLPVIGWIIALVTLSSSSGYVTSRIAKIILVVFLISFPLSLSNKNISNLNFQKHATDFDATKTGAEFCFPVNPDPVIWKTCLIKR